MSVSVQTKLAAILRNCEIQFSIHVHTNEFWCVWMFLIEITWHCTCQHIARFNLNDDKLYTVQMSKYRLKTIKNWIHLISGAKLRNSFISSDSRQLLRIAYRGNFFLLPSFSLSPVMFWSAWMICAWQKWLCTCSFCLCGVVHVSSRIQTQTEPTQEIQ